MLRVDSRSNPTVPCCSHAVDTERSNLARALHDNVIQSLIAAEMEVHTACRRFAGGSAVTIADLLKIQHILHNEVLGLRDLMQRLKPVQIQPEDLCDTLSECVAKFKADTGIIASFSAKVRRVSLTPPMCPPVVRLVQEALSNARKHSGARHVLVSIDEADGLWRLAIEDDGRGLDSSADHRPPLVIRECVRALDGELRLLTAPGGGLRLEITFTGDAVEVKRANGSLDRPHIRASRDRRVAPPPPKSFAMAERLVDCRHAKARDRDERRDQVFPT
jgi:signal transduction histidine kinase